MRILLVLLVLLNISFSLSDIGKLQEVFTWKQITYVPRSEGVAPARGNDFQFPDGERAVLTEDDPFYIQYNNVPMGVDRWGDKLFITMPRRRHGIPATLSYLLLSTDSETESPPLRPYPDYQTNALTVT